MERKRNIVLVLGTIVLLVGMNFATMPIGANGIEILPPSVTKVVSDEDICFGSIETQTTVTIEVTGDGGTSSTITPMDVVFAIDSSGSMAWSGHDPSKLRLAAAKYFVDQMDDSRDTGGVVSWDGGIDFTYPDVPPGGLSSDFVTLKDKIDDVNSNGGTNLNVGLGAAVAMLDSNTRTDPSSEVIIFLTDGLGTYTYYLDGLGDPDPTSPTYIAASQGYVIYSIGLGSSAASGPLEDMAFYTGGAYYSSPSAANLDDIYDDIYEEIVTSNIPHYVKVIEVLEEYIVLDEDSFNIEPDSITPNLDGTTTIVWENIGQYTSDKTDDLDADETVTLTFDVGADKPGYEMDVQVEGEAIVKYYDVDEVWVGDVDIPQAWINVAYSTDMIADGGDEYIDVGDIIIWQDDDYLYVKYVTDDGWEMTETHLHVVDADGVEVIPQTKKGNPKIGKFDYSADHSPADTEVTYKIDWTWASDALLYIAAHAVVQIEIESLTECTEPEYRMETAWGEGEDFGGSSWAMYFEYEDP